MIIFELTETNHIFRRPVRVPAGYAHREACGGRRKQQQQRQQQQLCSRAVLARTRSISEPASWLLCLRAAPSRLTKASAAKCGQANWPVNSSRSSQPLLIVVPRVSNLRVRRASGRHNLARRGIKYRRTSGQQH